MAKAKSKSKSPFRKVVRAAGPKRIGKRPPLKSKAKPPVRAKPKAEPAKAEVEVKGPGKRLGKVKGVLDNSLSVSDKVLSAFRGSGFPDSPGKVNSFLRAIKVVDSPLPSTAEQLIANKLGAFPTKQGDKVLGEVTAGLKETVKGLKGPAKTSAVLKWFQIGEDQVVKRGARLVSKATKFARTPTVQGIGALGAAAFVRKLREGQEKNRELDLVEATIPSGEDLFNQELLKELEFRNRARLLGQTGAGGGAEALLSELLGEGSSPLNQVTIPASSGFPTPR